MQFVAFIESQLFVCGANILFSVKKISPLSELSDSDDKRPHAAAFAPDVCISASGSKITPPEDAPLI